MEDLNEKIIGQIKPLVKKFAEKKKVYLYVMPFEKDNVDVEKIAQAISERDNKKEVKVWATNEKNKHDPENKAKKARPGMPGIFLD